MPSYVTVNNGAEIKSLTIKNECLKCIKKNQKDNTECGQVIGNLQYLKKNKMEENVNIFSIVAAQLGADIEYDKRKIFLQER